MPPTAASAQAPAVERPRHPLHALTTYELAGYRRQLERAIAFFAQQQPVPRPGPTCRPPSTPC